VLKDSDQKKAKNMELYAEVRCQTGALAKKREKGETFVGLPYDALPREGRKVDRNRTFFETRTSTKEENLKRRGGSYLTRREQGTGRPHEH